MKCAYCDREFVPKTVGVYCSDECRLEKRRETYRLDYQKRKAPPQYRYCLYCSTKFLAHGTQRYCEEHRTSTYRDKVRLRKKGEAKDDGGRYPISECYARLALAIMERCPGRGECETCVVDGWCAERRVAV